MNMEREVQILNINDVLPNRFQPRITFDEKAIMELADSIKIHGVIQPIVVRRIADKYEIIAGERRYKASVIAGKTTIPAIVTDLDDKDSAEIALIENVQRQDLTPIEEAVSYKKILDMGYLTQAELATKLGKTQSTIANKLRLLNLTDEVQEALLNEKISERHARSLLRLNKEQQNEMLNRIINERMTVRKTDEEIAKITNTVEMLDFNKKEENVNMNNEINSFNIPTSPIIEPNNSVNNFNELNVSPVQENPINSDTTIPDFNNINPGFMDINKIESEAKSIEPFMINNDISNEIPNFNEVGNDNINPGQFNGFEFNQNNQPANDNVPVGGRFFNNIVMDNQETNQNNDMVMPNIFNQTFNEPSLESNVNLNENINNNQPDNFGLPSLEDFGISNEDPIINPMIDQEIMEDNNRSVVEMGGSGMISEEPVLQPLMNAGEDNVKHELKEAIAIIRNCSNEIEKLGFKLDVEEIDFENFYQATFKIDKQ